MKYLLSTGQLTEKFEYYVLDLFRLYLQIYPGDIPGDSSIGFNFILTDTYKADLIQEIRSRISGLVSQFRRKFNDSVEITLTECSMIDEKLVKIVVSVDNIKSEEMILNIYEQ